MADTIIRIIERGITGLTGSTGPQGPPGLQGPPGPSGDDPFVHDQMVPSDSWLVVHNFGTKPSSVAIFDTTGRRIWTEIQDVDLNSLLVLWPSPTSGKAIVAP